LIIKGENADIYLDSKYCPIKGEDHIPVTQEDYHQIRKIIEKLIEKSTTFVTRDEVAPVMQFFNSMKTFLNELMLIG